MRRCRLDAGVVISPIFSRVDKLPPEHCGLGIGTFGTQERTSGRVDIPPQVTQLGENLSRSQQLSAAPAGAGRAQGPIPSPRWVQYSAPRRDAATVPAARGRQRIRTGESPLQAAWATSHGSAAARPQAERWRTERSCLRHAQLFSAG